jgi:serine/threonine protein kinase
LAAPTTSDEFLDVVRKSGMVPEPLLATCLKQCQHAADPKAVAEALVQRGLLTQFQSQQLLMGKSRGFNIGKYKILERIGAGGMALVYLCEDPDRQSRVAVKVLPNSHAQDEEYLKRFQREARAVAGLEHPNIVQTFDIDHDGKVNFIVMEYVEGTGLYDIVQNHGPLDPIRAAHYIRQAAVGLQRAHEASMVHRDIKPGNLMVDRTGTVKVLDMGLARIFSDSEEVLTRGILGTPDYFAPEQSKDSHNVDIRADIYGLGCTFYYLLTGAPPFPEGSIAQKLVWHQTRQPKPIRALRPEVPEGLAAVIHKMLAKDPGQRYQTPAEVAEALGPWTKAPIPPPSEAEMPRLSLAAQGGRETTNDMAQVTPGPKEKVPAPRPAAKASPATPVKAKVAPKRIAGNPEAATPRPQPRKSPSSMADDTASRVARRKQPPVERKRSWPEQLILGIAVFTITLAIAGVLGAIVIHYLGK